MVLGSRIKLNHLVHLLCLVPLLALGWDGALGNLTANPVQALTQRTGLTALVILLISLSGTPLQTYFNFHSVHKSRRLLGLYAFFYAALHVSIFLFLDYGANLTLIWLDINNKKYILIGALAFTILFILAVTSFRYWKLRLGRRWKTVHRAVYFSAGLAIIHYIWAVKADIRVPLIYLALLLFLLILRLPMIKRTLSPLTLKVAQRIKGIFQQS